MKKRVISLLLMLAMLLSLLPVSAMAVDWDEAKEQVRVIVENTTFPKSEEAPWEGTLVDTWVDLNADSTMMTCVGAALKEKGYTAKGLENNYIKEINDLAEFDGGSGSGWMGTLNDWFTNQGFGAYTVAAGTLGANDEIRIMYTRNYGADLGGTWGNSDTSLKALSFSKGTLAPAFESKTLEYTLNVPADTESIVVTPTAANKNFQVHTKIGETEYKRTAAVPVADGTVLTIEVGTGASMNEGATPTIYTVTIHKDVLIDPTLDAQWPVFRGNSDNNGLTAAQTPRTAEETELKWAKKLSTGWTDAPSPAIIVDNALISMCGSTLKKLDITNGEVLKEQKMAGPTNWGTVPPTYGNGMIFCPLSESRVQAFDAKTLAPLWIYKDERSGQSQSPIAYADGKLYVGLGYNGPSSFVCLNAADGSIVWREEDPNGYYWAGAVVVEDYVIYGGEAGHLISRNKDTGELVADLTVEGTPNIRSTISYADGHVFFTTKKAQLCKADLDTNTGALSNLVTLDCSKYGAESTSTPAIYNGIAYFGVGSFSKPQHVVAVNLERMEVVWSIEQLGNPQCSVLLSTAYADTGYVYLYVTYNANPGGMNVIKAKIDGSEATQSVLFDARGYEQYCICSVITDREGNLYYKNDSGNMFALGMTQDSKNQVAAEKAEALINAIGEVTLNSQEKIEAARAAYDALTDEQKALVSNYAALEKAEKTLAQLKETAANEAAAKEVVALIDDIGEVTLKSQEKIEAARAAYDALTDEQKALVSNYAALEKAEKTLAQLKEEAEQETAVKEVVALIDDIGEVTLDSQEKIEAARAAYNKLTDEQKKLVSNYEVLEAAEESLRIWQLPKVDTAKAFKDTGDYLENLAKEHTPEVNSIGGEWLVLGLVRSGRAEPAGYYENVLDYVAKKINDKEQLHRNKSSDNSRVILGLTAIGKDVTAVAGHNLLKGLTDMKYLKKQGINGPIWALIAFDSHNYEIPTVYEGGEQVTREGLIEYILSEQLADGGWALSGTAADPDMTAMAIQSLARYYKENETVKTAVDKALDTLSKLQQPNGGYATWGTVNSESSAQVIVALTTLGIDPNTDARFIKNGRSVVNALCDYFVEGGGFKHVAELNVDGMASEQAYYALTACDRLQKGQKSLYDMTDVKIGNTMPFTDVPEGKWYYGAVEFVYQNGLMNGISDTQFAPQHKLTRGQLVTILYRMEKEPEVAKDSPFVDLKAGSYYEKAVEWAYDNEIASGVDKTHFAPAHPVTREQMVTFFARYAENVKGADMSKKADLSRYEDAGKVSNFATKAMAWAVGNGIVNGVTATQLKPKGTAVRAQAAQIIERLWNFVG